MKDRAEEDVLGIEPSSRDLVAYLDDEKFASTAAKIIVYSVTTPRPLPAGTILRKVTSQEGREAKLSLKNSATPEEVLRGIESEFNRKIAEKIRQILGKEFAGKSKVTALNFDSSKARALKKGSVPGLSGEWERRASGGTWTIYTNRDETKVIKAPATDNGGESAILALTHETVAEMIEERYSDSGLRGPGGHSIVVANIDGSKMAVAVMDYENNYVSSDMKGLKEAQKALKEMYRSGELPTHEFDYDEQGLGRRNLAYRDGKFIALDLCDKSVLEDTEYLKKHGILEKARKMGFRPEKDSSDSSLISGFFSRFF